MFKFRKVNQHLSDKETFYFKKSIKFHTLYLSVSVFLLTLFSAALNTPNKAVAYFVELIALALLFLANEKLYIPYHRHNKRSDDYLKGIVGETRIQKELEKLLSDNFSVFQHIDISKYGDIDFVVIGRGFVFTVEVKHYSNPVDTDGEDLFIDGKKDKDGIIRKARGGAVILQKLLESSIKNPLFIHPVVVFAGKKSVISFAPRLINGVYVCDEHSLINSLMQKNTTNRLVSDEDSKKICNVIESIAQIKL